jgi:hypothetical protein
MYRDPSRGPFAELTGKRCRESRQMRARLVRIGFAIATVTSFVLVLGAPARHW